MSLTKGCVRTKREEVTKYGHFITLPHHHTKPFILSWVEFPFSNGVLFITRAASGIEFPITSYSSLCLMKLLREEKHGVRCVERIACFAFYFLWAIAGIRQVIYSVSSISAKSGTSAQYRMAMKRAVPLLSQNVILHFGGFWMWQMITWPVWWKITKKFSWKYSLVLVLDLAYNTEDPLGQVTGLTQCTDHGGLCDSTFHYHLYFMHFSNGWALCAAASTSTIPIAHAHLPLRVLY